MTDVRELLKHIREFLVLSRNVFAEKIAARIDAYLALQAKDEVIALPDGHRSEFLKHYGGSIADPRGGIHGVITVTDTSDWIPYDGSGMPVDARTIVEVRFRYGTERVGTANTWPWLYIDNSPRIIAYRLAKDERNEHASQQAMPNDRDKATESGNDSAVDMPAADACPTPPIWKFMPREATEEMHAAANREWDGRMSARSAGVWKAMFDVAPTPPSAGMICPACDGDDVICLNGSCPAKVYDTADTVTPNADASVPVAAPLPEPAKWCSHCKKDNHSDAECWSTRMIRPQGGIIVPESIRKIQDPAAGAEGTPETDEQAMSPKMLEGSGLVVRESVCRRIERDRNRLQRENEELRKTNYAELMQQYRDRIEKLTKDLGIEHDLCNKFIWQVRDTCLRAETAERELADLKRAAEAVELPEWMPELIKVALFHLQADSNIDRTIVCKGINAATARIAALTTQLAEAHAILTNNGVQHEDHSHDGEESLTLTSRIECLLRNMTEVEDERDEALNDIVDLKAQLAERDSTIATQHHKFTEDLGALNAELCARDATIEALRVDAERYWWILTQAAVTDFIFKYLKSRERHVSNAIDAARAAPHRTRRKEVERERKH